MDLKTEILSSLLGNRLTTLVGVVMVVFLATRWNTMGRAEIVAFVISALVHGVAKDPL